MKYIEVKIYTTKEGIDPLTCILMDMGIAGFVVEDADDFAEFLDKKNSYDWDYVDESLMELANIETNITFYLDDKKENKDLLVKIQDSIYKLKDEELSSELGNKIYGILQIEVKVADDEQWKNKWKEYFKPTKITDRIVIKPSWEIYQKLRDDEIVIEIDPGMAFGTGTHETTSLCIKLLSKDLDAGNDPVLDIGCGSGILAITASLLGSQKVTGVEIDPVAVEVARENIALNHLSSRIEVMEGDLTRGLNFKADIIVANLMADLVMLLSKDVAEHLQGKSIYISSGILIEKQEMVVEAIRKCGFHILEILEEGEWCAIAAQLSNE